MSLVAIGLIAILTFLGLLHLYWGSGGFWPGVDPPTLAERVAGTRGRAPPGFVACAMVALALFAAAGIVALRQTRIETLLPALIVYGGYGVLVLVFGLRGLAAYSPAFNYARGTPFYGLNRVYYGPLCLLIAAGFVLDFPREAGRALGLPG